MTGRKHGAFLMALVALAGLSRLRYPKQTAPSIYFDRLREYHPNQLEHIARIEQQRDKKKPFQDGEAFKCTLLDLIADIILPNPPPGMCQPRKNIVIPFGSDRKDRNIEEIFYEAFRCTFVHEAKMTSDVFLTAPTPQGDVLRLTHPTGIPESWIPNLIVAIRDAPEINEAGNSERKKHG